MLGRSLFSHRPSPAMLVALVALVVALAGTAIANPAKLGLNKREKQEARKIARAEANRQISNRAPRLTVKRAQTATTATSASSALNAASAAEANNAGALDGRDSSSFADAADLLWAVTLGNGTLVRGRGAVSTSLDQEGVAQLTVVFDRDISECSATATVTHASTFGNGRILGIFLPLPANHHALVVDMRDTAGAPDAEPLSIQVIC